MTGEQVTSHIPGHAGCRWPRCIHVGQFNAGAEKAERIKQQAGLTRWRFLKLRVSTLCFVKHAKALGIITTRSVSFEVARFHVWVCKASTGTGIYHNPKPQRGIYGNPAENAKSQSLADAAGCDRHKCAASKSVSEGSLETLRKMQKHNPSLTQRIGADTKAQLQNWRFAIVRFVLQGLHRRQTVGSEFWKAQPVGWKLTVLLCSLLLAMLSPGSMAMAKDKPRVGLKMELMSIRNRSSGPLPVRVRVEYNAPQILEGDLELSIYDAQETYTREDLMATIRHEDIVLAGRDYEFQMILPPLKTAVIQNWAVEAWFITADERIPLSSIPDRINPPEAHDLLITSPLERGVLLCSCARGPSGAPASTNRKFLEEALSLDNYNPLYDEAGLSSPVTSSQSNGVTQVDKIGRTVIYFAGQWTAREMPLDPLAYCAFDVVLLSDGALGQLTADQMAGLRKWVLAGGSLCVLPDEPVKPEHLDFLRTILAEGLDVSAGLTLDSDGRLQIVSVHPEPVVMAHYGLGRAVLLPDVENVEQRLSREERGAIVGHLWKVRHDQSVHQGKPWGSMGLLQTLRANGIQADQDENGVYLTDPRMYQLGQLANNGRTYVNRHHLLRILNVDSQLSPKTEQLLAETEYALLPSDIAMVPSWVIVLILSGYVLTIGPVDYFLLGWLRMRNYTWILFPVITMLFTFLTVAVANSYMSSKSTGGKLVITDVVEDGQIARQSIIETLYFGAKGESRTDHASQTIVQAQDNFNAADWENMYSQGPPRSSDPPLNYSGHFPQNYLVTQEVQQWSPITLRSMSLEPEGVVLPGIDWNDTTLVTTPEGQLRLRQELEREQKRSGHQYLAMVQNKSVVTLVHWGDGRAPYIPGVNDGYNPLLLRNRLDLGRHLLGLLAVTDQLRPSFFQVVSQVSPSGSASLEDLTFLDVTDPQQWALFVMRVEDSDFHVFRRLYVMKNDP